MFPAHIKKNASKYTKSQNNFSLRDCSAVENRVNYDQVRSIFIMMSEVADNNWWSRFTHYIKTNAIYKQRGVPRISGITLNRNITGSQLLPLLGQLQTKSWWRHNCFFVSCSWTLKTRAKPLYWERFQQWRRWSLRCKLLYYSLRMRNRRRTKVVLQ